ncbi:7136_t:CDS:2 [Funneliformis caledonium]|uniref:7136_t:CDS:1 n=1 Tax=Funneliformis caledonium TaxID=1117310 RepID=A0A9N9NG92_9GLOM|nr:7136_t:CDS:2 [Funneliformis caledonium]
MLLSTNEKEYETLPFSTKQQPKRALVAKNNGYWFYEKIIQQAQPYLTKNFLLIMEIGYQQQDKVIKLIIKHFFSAKVAIFPDYGGHSRVIAIYKYNSPSPALDSIKQDYSLFQEYINRNKTFFTSRSGNTLIIPRPEKNENGQELDYKNLTSFIQNLPKVSIPYLHVRIDSKPIYYSYEKYKEFTENQPNQPKHHPPKALSEKPNKDKHENNANNKLNRQKEKILCNLDKITFDRAGHLANAELLKGADMSLAEQEKAGAYQIKIEGEEINLREFERLEQEKNYLEIRKKFVDNLKKNISD